MINHSPAAVASSGKIASVSHPDHGRQIQGNSTSGIRIEGAFSRLVWNSSWPRLALLGLILCGSSCSTASRYVQNTFHPTEQAKVAAAGKESTDKTKSADARAASTPDNATQAKSSQASVAAKPGAAPVQKPDVRELISKGQDPFGDSSIQQASNEQPAHDTVPANSMAPAKALPQSVAAETATADESGTIQHTNQPRAALNTQLASAVAASSSAGACPPAAPCAARPFPGAEIVSDEYICDGGDQGDPVHYQGMNRAGLGLEDTIAEYQDDTGKMRMKPSTEACVYAPRFGSVSSATLPEEGLQIARAAGHQDQNTASGLKAKMVIDEKAHTDEVQGMRTRSRASGVNQRQTDGELGQAQNAVNQEKLVNAYEDFRFLREGQFDRTHNAVIGLGIDAAQEWADGRRPIIIATDEGGQIIQGRFTVQDFTGVEDKRTPGELKLVKVADRGSAHPGDVITFTIRFDNTGGRDLTKVRVVDNLSPRLEYIENSISSNLEGKVNVDDNGFGSKLLTFEFDQPLKGNTGGYVSFQCRVR